MAVGKEIDMTKLVIVVPCYNEEAVLPACATQLRELLDDLESRREVSAESRICFVDDGSQDDTWRLIQDLTGSDSRICGIKLSRNHGHQRAVLAGLSSVNADVVVSIDADLQDDVNCIRQMLAKYREGAEIVYGVRRDRQSDTFFKRWTARVFYRFLGMLGVEIVRDHADFRLMSKRVLEVLADYQEANLFLRGVVPTIGFPSAVVTYVRNAREAGESKYPLRRMLSLAVDGVTSFSAVPLRLIAGLGVVIFLVTIALSVWVFWIKLTNADAVPGWASSVLPMYLLGGIQLLSIGVVGEYIAKIYMETKRRPRFIIQSLLGDSEAFLGRGMVQARAGREMMVEDSVTGGKNPSE